MPALMQVMWGVLLASQMPLKSVVRWRVELCGGGELLQVDGGGAPLGFQLHGVLLGGPGVMEVVGGALRRLPAVCGVGVVHESLLGG